MPKYNDTNLRQRIIDKCLQSSKNYSIRDLMNACNEELTLRGEPPITSMNTIRDDIERISTTYPEAVIVARRAGRNIYYSYEDKNYSIFKVPLKDEEFAQLTQTVAILSRFKGMPQFDWINEFIDKFKSSICLNHIDKPIVGFDENIDLVGRNFFFQLFSSIVNKQVLKLYYKDFKNESIKEFIIHPYYLKQYNKRWFLMAYTEGYSNLSTYAFDRIDSILPLHKDYVSNTKYDFDEYFDDMIGVTKYDNTNIETIKIWVSPLRWPYIETKPLHGTQKIVSQDDTGTIIQIQVFVNKELEQLILSYGKDMKVIEPISLQIKIRENLSITLKNYK